MRKVISVLLAAALMLALMPAAMAGSGMKLASQSGWVNIPSSADISYETDSDGNYTINIAVPYKSISSVRYDQYLKKSGKVFIFPIITGDKSLVRVDGSTAPVYNGKACVVFWPESGGRSEKFSVIDFNNMDDAFMVTINYYDASKLSYDWWKPVYPNYPSYPYNTYFYCNYCNRHVMHGAGDYCLYENNSYYYYCSNYCYLQGWNQHVSNTVNPVSYLRAYAIEASGDQYGNVSLSNSYADLKVDIFGITASDRNIIANAGSDYVRIRVQPVTIYGGTYPAGTIVSVSTATSKVSLEGSEVALTDKGTYVYVLDKNGTFCINLPGIKSLAGYGSGKWATLKVSLGNYAQTFDATVYYGNTARGSASVIDEPAYSSSVSVKTGESMPLNYVLGDVQIPAKDVVWTVYSAGTGRVSLNGNVVTGILSGTAFVKAQYGNSSSIVKINVTATSGSGTIVAGGSSYKVTALSLNVRSGPGTGYSVLGAIPAGTLVTGYGFEKGWLKINYNGYTAYVAGNFVSAVK